MPSDDGGGGGRGDGVRRAPSLSAGRAPRRATNSNDNGSKSLPGGAGQVAPGLLAGRFASASFTSRANAAVAAFDGVAGAGDDGDDDAKPLLATTTAAVDAADPAARALYHRLHVALLPPLAALALACYIDRTNLAFASLQLTADLGFSPSVYGTGSSLFFVSYALTMVPAQLALTRIGAPRFLGVTIALWGATAAMMAAVRGKASFYTCRLLLGAAESPAFPGAWFYLSSSFPPERLAVPMSVLEASVSIANVVAAPLAAGLLMLDGLAGLRGWQGLPSLALGVALPRMLPRDVTEAAWLSDGERAALSAALAPARRHAGEAAACGARRLLSDALRNGRLWALAGVGLLKGSVGVGLLFFAPLLVDAIVSGGGGGLDAAAAAKVAAGGGDANGSTRGSAGVVLLTAGPFALSAACTLMLGHRAQARGHRAAHVAAPYFAAAVLLAMLPYCAAAGPAAGFVCLSACIAAVNSPTGILNSMASSAAAGPAQAVSFAVYNAVANIGGVIGPALIGAVAERSGSYASAMHALAAMMAAAAVGVYAMRRWGL